MFIIYEWKYIIYKIISMENKYKFFVVVVKKKIMIMNVNLENDFDMFFFISFIFFINEFILIFFMYSI